MSTEFLESIVTQLKESAQPSSDAFCAQVKVPFKDLSLSVDPVGRVMLPVTAKMAKSLIVEAELARYGLKDKTFLDRRIRDTWEIPKSRIHTDQAWVAQLRKALLKIKKDLNLPDDGVLTADLHNLLIYMPGQFFKAHQDSEKAEGMVATLVVVLPSEFTGGELVIDQHGDRRVFDFSEKTESLSFVAFYSDCHHEVKEITSGYRLALTYNLFFKPKSEVISTRRNTELEKAVQRYFSQNPEDKRKRAREKVQESEYTGETQDPQWLVYLLDHEYTRSSLDWPHLRGLDRERVGELLACADQLGLTAHLSLADVHETWSTEGDDGWRGRYRYRRRWRDEDDDDGDDDENAESKEYVLTELIEDEIVLRHWIARSGKKFEGWDKYVPKHKVCWTKAVDQFKPFKSEYEGYQGNYGNTLDRWYHRAAIILWKKETDLISLFACDKTQTLKSIAEVLKNDLIQGRKMLRQIIPYWPEEIHHFMDPALVLEFAFLIQDEDLASTLVKTAGLGSVKKKNLQSLMKLMDSYGQSWLIQILNFWRERHTWRDENSILQELFPLVGQLSQKYSDVSHWILEDQLSLLVRDDVGREHSDRKLVRKELPKRIMIIKTLLKACHSVGESKICDKIVKYVLGKKLLYPEVDLVNLFLELDESLYAQVLLQLRQRLEKQESAPRKDGDWSIQDAIPHHCSDCQYLKAFLQSSSAQKLVWPLAKDRRAHIHGMIDSMDIPVTHETLRQGSPHKLVLTKTSELFKRDQKRVSILKVRLTKLRRLNL